jgi:rod shape-determining protein MreB
LSHAIARHIKNTYSIEVGDNTAEQVKMQIGSAIALEPEERMRIRGRDLRTGMPTEVEVTSTEIATAIRPQVTAIVNSVKMVLERTAPELASDLLDRGIVMGGGTSQLRGLSELIAQETGLPCRVAPDPLTCVARGCAALLENLDALKQILETGTRN